jgi:hypothetical protein
MDVTVLEGTIAGAAIRAAAVVDELRSLDGLLDAAEQLLAACAASGSPVLVPASSDGAALVGAAVAVGSGQVRSASAGGAGSVGGKAMVVEVAAVSGLAVRRQVEALRAAGGDWVGVFVWRLHAARGRPPTWGDADEIVIAG